MEDIPQNSSDHCDLVTSTLPGYLQYDQSPQGKILATQLAELHAQRARDLLHLCMTKGYNARVQEILHALENNASFLHKPRFANGAAQVHQELLQELDRRKKQRLEQLHADPDVRRIFYEFFEKEQPIKEHFMRIKRLRNT